MRDGSKHGTDFSWFSKGKVHLLNKVFFVPVVNPATKLESYPKANRQMFHNKTKCVWEFPPALAAKNNSGIRQIFMDGNRGHGRFQFFRPRRWPCFCMVLTLVLHRQLTSLAETFDGLAQGLHKILRVNSGRTLDNLRFSGNKSLHEENDLRKKRPR